MTSTEPNLILYTQTTPNGIKISIALEELGYVLDMPHTALIPRNLPLSVSNLEC